MREICGASGAAFVPTRAGWWEKRGPRSGLSSLSTGLLAQMQMMERISEELLDKAATEPLRGDFLPDCACEHCSPPSALSPDLKCRSSSIWYSGGHQPDLLLSASSRTSCCRPHLRAATAAGPPHRSFLSHNTDAPVPAAARALQPLCSINRR